MVLPIVDRELRLRSRLAGTYRSRAIAGGVATLIAAGTLILARGFSAPSAMGAGLFGTLSWLGLAFCLLEGARTTSDCLSSERREGTLGLLFLTDLRGYDVALGKFAGASLSSFYSLVAMLPVLAVPLVMGGVTPGEYWRMVLLLVNVLFLSVAAGLWVSSISREERKAMGGTLATVVAVCVMPWVVGFAVALAGSRAWGDWLGGLSPLSGMAAARDLAYAADAGAYWLPMVVTQGMAWGFLAGACWIVPRAWREEAAPAEIPWDRWWRWAGARYGVREWRERMLERNPVFWLALRRTGQSPVMWGMFALAAVGAVGMWRLGVDAGTFFWVYLAGGLILNWTVRCWVAAQACHFFNEARASGGLELMLATPITPREMLRGQAMHLRRLFTPPVVAVCVLHLGALAGAVVFAGIEGEDFGFIIASALLASFALLGFVADVCALACVGTWLGLTEGSYTRAVTKTIVFVLVYPLVLYFCPFLWLFWWFGIAFLRVGAAIAFIAWANQNLKDHFRAVAAQRLSANDSEIGWWPFRKPRSAARAPLLGRMPPPLPRGRGQ